MQLFFDSDLGTLEQDSGDECSEYTVRIQIVEMERRDGFFHGASGILGKNSNAPRLGSTFRRTELLTGYAGARPHNSIKPAQQRTIAKNPAQY